MSAVSFKKIIPALYLVAGAWNMVLGQEKTVTKINQQWIQYYGMFEVSDRWTLQADAGLRWQDGFAERRQYILRIGTDYDINERFSASGGIAQLGTYEEGSVVKIEFRPYQDISMKVPLGKLDLTNRFRVEERFYNPVTDGHIETPNSFNFRFRYALIAHIPLFSLSDKDPGTRISLNVGDEVSVNAGKRIVYTVFDQNRFNVSPSVDFNHHLAIALTWSVQYLSSEDPGHYTRSNIYWLQIRQRINAGRKTK